MTDYTWIDPELDLAGVDAIEVSGVIETEERADHPGSCTALRYGNPGERCDDDPQATFWSCYTHRDGEGATCVSDHNTVEEAQAFAKELALRAGCGVNDFA